jgi:hypothetical protein
MENSFFNLKHGKLPSFKIHSLYGNTLYSEYFHVKCYSKPILISKGIPQKRQQLHIYA